MGIFTESLDVATCVVVLASLWIRRKTWRYRWEQPKTIGLTLMAAGTLIKAPPLCWLMDQDIVPGLHLLIAHIFILSGVAVIAYGMECKLRSETDICPWRAKFIVTPWSLGVASMVTVFVLYRLSEGYTPVDWLIYDVTGIYFLGVCTYSLWCLFYDPPSRVGAAIYLAAVGSGLVAATCRALLATVDSEVPDMVLINVACTANAIALSLFAGGGAWLWKMRLREMNRQGTASETLKKKV